MQFFNSFYLFSEIRPDSEVLLINITHCDVDYPKCSSLLKVLILSQIRRESSPPFIGPLSPSPFGPPRTLWGDLSPHAKICCGSPEVCVLTIELDKRNKFWDISYFYPWNFDKSENFTAKWNICFQNFTAAIQYIITLEFSTQNMGRGYDIIGRGAWAWRVKGVIERGWGCCMGWGYCILLLFWIVETSQPFCTSIRPLSLELTLKWFYTPTPNNLRNLLV